MAIIINIVEEYMTIFSTLDRVPLRLESFDSAAFVRNCLMLEPRIDLPSQDKNR